MTDERRITSTANPRVRAAGALRSARDRRVTGRTLVDGAREARRALERGVPVAEAFICEPLLSGPDAAAVLERLRAGGMPVWSVSETVLAKLAFGDRSEGIVLVVEWAPLGLADLQLPPAPLLLVLEGVEKPGNLGAAMRSADGAGVHAVIAASPRTDLANPNVIRASAGTAFSVPVVAAPAEDALTWLRANGVRVVAARVEAARGYTEADLTGPVALVLGAEDVGLSDVWTGPDVEAIRLPMLGIADSLNVSVTAAVLAYEARRQRDLALALREASPERTLQDT